jgi:hypothetical protein
MPATLNASDKKASLGRFQQLKVVSLLRVLGLAFPASPFLHHSAHVCQWLLKSMNILEMIDSNGETSMLQHRY